MALRLRRLAYACAVASAGATIAVVLVARLDFAYRSPSLHVALETTAAITAATAAFLVIGRFRRTGYLDELLLSAGLLMLAFLNFAFAAIPAVLDLGSNRASVWGGLFCGTLAAILISLSALLPRRQLSAVGRWPMAVYGGTVGIAIGAVLVFGALQRYLPYGIKSSHGGGAHPPHIVAQPAVLTLQLYLAVLYLLAALGFVRRQRVSADEFSGWLAIACVFSAATRVNYFFHPSLLSSWVYTADVFRLGFYIALLVGAAREITSYWTSSLAAASLEERRRLARDVHDGLAQEIAFIARNVRLLPERGAEPQLVERILGGVARAQEESKRVVGALAWEVDEPVELALAQAARDAARRYGASVEMELDGGILLSPRERDAVVRIASEAVANAARHSSADRLRIYLERLDKGMRLEIVDDGVGFDQEPEQPESNGFGLATMRDRADALGAKLNIHSRKGSGTKVELEL